MKYSTDVFILIIFLLNCININSNAQATIPKADSTRIIHREAPVPCPTPYEDGIRVANPLRQYCFYSFLNAVYTVTDSLGVITNLNDYRWYFDDSSNYVAMKMQTMASSGENKFILDELVDSIHFTVHLKEAVREAFFTNYRKCDDLFWYHNQITRLKDLAYKPTGKTKTILGYLCEEYFSSDDVTENTFWVVNLDDPWIRKIQSDLSHTENYPHIVFSTVGIIMESEIYYKNNHTFAKFKVTEINKKSFYRISSEGRILNLGF